MISLLNILGDNIFLVLLIIAGIVGGGILYYLVTEKPWQKKNEEQPQRRQETNPANIPLRLAAYERLVLFVERMSLPNVISRVNVPGVDKSTMQLALNQNIREEFEYNLSQQVYVSSSVWNAVSMLKDQNILIINQVAATLPAEASGIDLNRKILEFCANSEIGSLQSKVSEAINIEAKQVMNS